MAAGAQQRALHQALIAAGFRAVKAPPSVRMGSLPRHIEDAVMDLYRALGGIQPQPTLAPNGWDCALTGPPVFVSRTTASITVGGMPFASRSASVAAVSSQRRGPDAQRLAESYHEGQVDKAGQPYLGHVFRVARRVGHLDAEAVAVALLHDVRWR